MIGLVLPLLVVLGYISYKLWLRKYEKAARKIPGDENYTILGDLSKFILVKEKNSIGFLELYKRIFEKYTSYGILKFWMGPFFSVVTWEPEYIAEIASNKATSRKGKLFSVILGNVASGVFANEGNHEWKELRHFLNKSMKKTLLENKYHGVFIERAKEFISYLKEKKSNQKINLLTEISWLHCDAFSETHLGFRTNNLRQRKYNTLELARQYIEERIQSVLKVWPLLFDSFISNRQYTDQGYQYFYNVINERRRILAKDNKESDSIFYSDFLIKRAANNKLEDEITCSHLSEITVAGSEAPSVLSSTLLVFLAMYPELQEEIYQEQVNIFGDDLGREPDLEDLKKMELLNMTIKEVLRHTSTPLIHKQATADIQLGQYEIPKGTFILINLHKVHHDPKYWERPEEFYPDHFLPEKVAARPAYAFIPFGIGIRNCPGMQYSFQEIKTELSLVIRHFKFLTNYKYEDVVYGMTTLCQLKPHLYDVTFQERIHTKQDNRL